MRENCIEIERLVSRKFTKEEIPLEKKEIIRKKERTNHTKKKNNLDCKNKVESQSEVCSLKNFQ